MTTPAVLAAVTTTIVSDATCKATVTVKLPSKTEKQRSFRWSTGAVVSCLTLSLFMADFVLLGQKDEARWFGSDLVVELWNSARSYFSALDFFLAVFFLSLIALQLTRRKSVNGGARKTTKGTGHTSKIARNSTNRRKDDATCTEAAPNSGAPRPAPVERPVTRWNQAIDIAARQGDAEAAGLLLLDFEREGAGQVSITSRPDTVSYNLVIRAYAKKGDFKRAQDWLTRMETRGLEATAISYNTVLDAYAKADNAEACEAWLLKMLDKGIETNVISYATVIYARARRGEEAEAEVWMRKMIAAGITPDAISYNSMIHACGVNGNCAGAQSWLQEMQERGLEATVTTFTAVIDSCAKAGDVPRAEKVLEAMLVAKVDPNVVSFSTLIDACAKAADPARAEFWHDRMVECNIKPNAHSFSCVINACAKGGDVARAEEWLGKAETAGAANDVIVYSSVIDACGKAGDAERATAIFERMRSRGLHAHIVAYAALARPYAYRGDWGEVERIALDMDEHGIAPNEYFLYAHLLSYATARPRQAQRAEQCFRDALSRRLKANDHVVSALARAVGGDRCVELMDELCQGRALPSSFPGGMGGSRPARQARPQARRP